MEEIYLEEDGIVSVWIGQKPVAPGSNFLRDGFGIEYYDPDNQECIVADSVTPIGELVTQFSYCESFQDAVTSAAERMKIHSALWIMAQYDYAYDAQAAQIKSLPKEPVFIGKFPWHEYLNSDTLDQSQFAWWDRRCPSQELHFSAYGPSFPACGHRPRT